MTLPVNLRCELYSPGTGGAPSSTLLVDLAQRIDDLTFSTSARFGFESASVSLVTPVEEALMMALQWLMHGLVISGPDGTVCWEGFLHGVELQAGQKRRSISLEGLANRVRTRYTTVLGTPGTTGTYSNTTSQGIYGVKDAVLDLPETTTTAARNYAQAFLAANAYPKSIPASDAYTGALGDIRVTLSFVGWWDTLKWLLTSNTTTSTAVTTTQVTDLLTAYNLTNAFFGTSTANVTASGVSDTQYIEANTTYFDKVQRLLEQGNSSNQRLAWGIYEDRTLYVSAWAGATPDTVTYYESIRDGLIYSSGGAVVAPWDVRPNAMVETMEFLDPAPVSTAPDSAARFFCERTTCSVSRDRIGVTLEPTDTDNLSARLARLTPSGRA